MRKFLLWFFPGIIAGIIIILCFDRAVNATSTNNYCASCHVHPQATSSWKKSVHYSTKSGYHVSCTECHLPPKGEGYLTEKSKTGLRDLWSYWTKDSASFDWEAAGSLERASKHVYNATCLKCHENLFPAELTRKGADAHLYYKQMTEKGEDLQCIACHLNSGHYIEGYTLGSNKSFGQGIPGTDTIYTTPAVIKDFSTFKEQIPGTGVSFKMVAIPGGTFKMGSPEDEPLRGSDEGPVHEVTVSSFFMAEVEVTWDEYMAFYAQTAAEGRSTDTEGIRKQKDDVDAISGATPPYGQPDQKWGMGQRPAISMSFHAAETYCRWLSKVTGKKYRLPTEAEWEYACRAKTETPYFFTGDPKEFVKKGIFKNRPDTAVINTYVVYNENSPSKTQEPSFVKPNAFGLKNMSGNVAEFCSDWYGDYVSGSLTDPRGPESGEEHVIRGGSFRNDAKLVRSASRDHTRTDEWLRTDPQMPKSIWWYSDCFYVGFRVVCEVEKE